MRRAGGRWGAHLAYARAIGATGSAVPAAAGGTSVREALGVCAAALRDYVTRACAVEDAARHRLRAAPVAAARGAGGRPPRTRARAEGDRGRRPRRRRHHRGGGEGRRHAGERRRRRLTRGVRVRRAAPGNLSPPQLSAHPMTTEHALIELAHDVATLDAMREGALRVLGDALDAEVGLFVTLPGDRPARSFRGLPQHHCEAMHGTWERTGVEVRLVKEQAARDGASTDRRVLGPGLTRTVLYREVMAPVGGTETLFIVPTVAGRAVGLVALGRRGGTFSEAAIAHARGLRAALSVACRAVGVAWMPAPALSPVERDLLDYLALGLGTRQIAEARGTSFFTVRNQLSALYRKLDVANRAEAIGRLRGRAPR